MKTTVDFYDFREAFRRHDRMNNFPNSLKALFDFLEQYGEDCDTEVELDVVGFCCEYEENNFADLPAYYTDIDLPDVADFTDEDGMWTPKVLRTPRLTRSSNTSKKIPRFATTTATRGGRCINSFNPKTREQAPSFLRRTR